MNVAWAHKTDKGLLRAANEDAVDVVPEAGFCVVADGMGGHSGGHVASKAAVASLKQSLGRSGAHPEVHADLLREAVQAANQAILDIARRDLRLTGMGTTVVLGVGRGNQMLVAHVGDSRAYLFRDGVLECLTADHTLVAEQVRLGLLTREEARKSHLQNIVTRAVGVATRVQTDVLRLDLKQGDMLMLCSDGLTSMVDDSTIQRVLTNGPEDVHACADALVAAAIGAGGRDNVTVILARCGHGVALPEGKILIKVRSVDGDASDPAEEQITHPVRL